MCKDCTKDREPCVINDNYNSKVFCTWKRHSILFFLALGILVFLTNLGTEIERLTIFGFNYLYSAFANNAIFLNDIISIKLMVNTFFRTFPD